MLFFNNKSENVHGMKPVAVTPPQPRAKKDESRLQTHDEAREPLAKRGGAML